MSNPIPIISAQLFPGYVFRNVLNTVDPTHSTCSWVKFFTLCAGFHGILLLFCDVRFSALTSFADPPVPFVFHSLQFIVHSSRRQSQPEDLCRRTLCVRSKINKLGF